MTRSQEALRLGVQSGSRDRPPGAGDRWDNAAMGSFFSSLKTERTSRKAYRTRDQARADAFAYIERFHNSRRRGPSIGYVSAMAFEAITRVT